MFTGIVEEIGRVGHVVRQSAGARLTIACSSVLADVAIGASIAVNGACVTAIEMTANEFSADLSPETLNRTNLGDLETGSRRQSGAAAPLQWPPRRPFRPRSCGRDG